MIDYAALLFTPTYSAFGTDATITFADDTTLDVTVIDKTGGIEAGVNGQFGTLEVAAIMLASDLVDVGRERSDLDDANITFNDNDWRIASHYPKPVPTGEASGEIVLVLEAA